MPLYSFTAIESTDDWCNSANIIAAQWSFVWGTGDGCVRWSGSKRDRCRWDDQHLINTMERTDSGNVHYTSANFDEHFLCIWCSLAGHSEPQHLGNGDNSCAFPSCKPRVLINTKPGKFSTESYAFTKVFLTGNKDIALWHVTFYNTYKQCLQLEVQQAEMCQTNLETDVTKLIKKEMASKLFMHWSLEPNHKW